MTTQALTTTDAVHVGVPMMDATEARSVVTRIKTRIDLARGELLELHDREGWRALGYKSWQSCTTAEFGGSAAQMFRLLSAAQIERAIDSPIGEYPESHLREVARLDTPDQQKQALENASARAHGKPTARDVQAAVAEIAPPAESDLPLNYDVIKRRLAAHGVALLSNMQGHHRAFVTRRDGMTGVVTFNWPDVLSKLERLESDQVAAPADPAKSTADSDRAAHLAKESRDAGRLERAQNLIAAREYDSARTVLNGIEVATWKRDQLLCTIPAKGAHTITLALMPDECAALLKEARTFEQGGLTKQYPTLSQALILLVQGIRGAA